MRKQIAGCSRISRVSRFGIPAGAGTGSKHHGELQPRVLHNDRWNRHSAQQSDPCSPLRAITRCAESPPGSFHSFE